MVVFLVEWLKQQSLVEWLTATGTVAVCFLAVFQATIVGWFYRPRLSVSSSTRRPDLVPVFNTGDESVRSSIGPYAYYLRLRVQNTGNQAAELVELRLLNLYRKVLGSTQFEHVPEVIPDSFQWTFSHETQKAYIAPGTFHHVDLVSWFKPSVVKQHWSSRKWPGISEDSIAPCFRLKTEDSDQRNTQPSGMFQLEVELFGKNVPTRRFAILVTVPDAWHGDFDAMASGVAISTTTKPIEISA